MGNKNVIYTPVNRHLIIRLLEQPKIEKQTDQGNLLPDDFKPQQSEYAIVEVVGCADDVKLSCDRNTRALVERHMIKAIEYDEEIIHMVLENYVLCLMTHE